MATATNKKSAAKIRKTPPKATSATKAKPLPPSLEDLDAPDRAAPQLAEVDAEALEFIAAIDRFKKEHGRPFPSWSEVLLIVHQLGYRRR